MKISPLGNHLCACIENKNMYNKKTPEGVYAGCVGVRKSYRSVEWQWKVE